MDTQANTPLLLPAPTRYPPPYLLFLDLYVLISNLPSLLGIIRPVRTSNPRAELYPYSLGNISSMVLGIILILVGLASLLLIPIWLLVPGGVWLCWFIGVTVVTLVFSKFLNGFAGDVVVSSGQYVHGDAEAEDEKWFFVNGIMTGEFWLKTNIEEAERRFGRRIWGVHNRSYGLVLDLLQCLIQRDLRYSSTCVRALYHNLRTALLELESVPPSPSSSASIPASKPKHKKVVLLAHSQGALIASLVLDMLYADIPRSLLSRLEVYTFGNASNTFNNPLYRHGDTNSGALRYLEHYANRGEYVSRVGILGFMTSGDVTEVAEGWGNQFAGRVLVREGQGHLFVQHYLDVLFQDGFVEVGGGRGVGRLLGYRDGRVVE
ncbi:unnamed protein product [Tuber melanosporum]|uniref:(Perigord truffle) hypothetical protein n=1 Tax=Tuber melanosporum (strain Mel28) TaxID=656061 RepID=D5GNT0_TUBMM|nr:uncharacterized protein GSTUM_00011467001 [Tuber melanosporum]CAZ86173.1 unnamed protein product [Tuber melanosporum]